MFCHIFHSAPGWARVLLMKILVTGSSGVIGTRLCEKLLEAGHSLVCLDLRPNRLPAVNKFTMLGNLRDRKTLQALPKDFDFVVHLAANVGVGKSLQGPSLAVEDFETTSSLLEFIRSCGPHAPKLIFASSREVYGISSKPLLKEEDADVSKCASPYAASKLGGEALIWAYHRCYGLQFVILRFSNIYGMYDDELNRVIPALIRQGEEGKDLAVFPKEIDFLYIDDAVDAMLLSMEKFSSIRNDVFNIAQAKGGRLLDVAEKIRALLKKDVKVIARDEKEGEIMRSVADISKAKRKMGYSPKTTIEEGLEKTIRRRAARGAGK
jgi:UDP-glucose 4-epimerase